MTAGATRPVAIKIDEDTKARVERLADARQRTSRWLMREAITHYVDREEKREAFRQDALKACESSFGMMKIECVSPNKSARSAL